MAALPGAKAASLSVHGLGGSSWLHGITVVGTAPARTAAAKIDGVTPAYFDTVGMTLLRGRGVTSADDQPAPRVAVLNETLVRQLFGSEDPATLALATLALVAVTAAAGYLPAHRASRTDPMAALPAE